MYTVWMLFLKGNWQHRQMKKYESATVLTAIEINVAHCNTDGQWSIAFYCNYLRKKYKCNATWNKYFKLHCVQKKNTDSRFLLYLHEKCSDLYTIFRECLGETKNSVDVNTKYLLLLVTSFWRHIYTFVNTGFYRWRWDIWQYVCESARVMEPHVCARCFQTVYRQWNGDWLKTLIKKTDMTGSMSIDRQLQQEWSSMQCVYTLA